MSQATTRRYSAANIRHQDASTLRALSKRDARPTWAIVKDALSYYEKIHQKPRPAPSEGSIPRRGRPPKAIMLD